MNIILYKLESILCKYICCKIVKSISICGNSIRFIFDIFYLFNQFRNIHISSDHAIDLNRIFFSFQEKPHKCELCQKSFPTPGDLKSHMYIHNGSWPHRCHICDRGFSKITNLKNHLFLHTGKIKIFTNILFHISYIKKMIVAYLISCLTP